MRFYQALRTARNHYNAKHRDAVRASGDISEGRLMKNIADGLMHEALNDGLQEGEPEEIVDACVAFYLG